MRLTLYRERSVTALRTFDDDHVERWAAVYLDPLNNRILRARGVRFETFLLAPAELLAACRRPTAGLLSAQRDVQRRVDLACALAELAAAASCQFFGASRCENGRMVVSMHQRVSLRHHRAAAR